MFVSVNFNFFCNINKFNYDVNHKYGLDESCLYKRGVPIRVDSVKKCFLLNYFTALEMAY